jgi:hypothetical protein
MTVGHRRANTETTCTPRTPQMTIEIRAAALAATAAVAKAGHVTTTGAQARE